MSSKQVAKTWCQHHFNKHTFPESRAKSQHINNHLLTGETPDISALLQYYFYQPVLYLDKAQTFPKSKERSGWWVGVAENTRDALTYKIPTTNNKVLYRFVCRATDNPIHPNRRVEQDGKDFKLESAADKLDQEWLQLPTINPNKIVGSKFIKKINDQDHKAKVMEN